MDLGQRARRTNAASERIERDLSERDLSERRAERHDRS
jgi:hypothetical protein